MKIVTNYITRFIIVCLILTTSVYTYGQTIKGHVYSIEKDGKKPLPGATIFYPGTNIGTNTDAKGAYSISKVKGKDVLIAKLMGFSTDSVRISGQSTRIDFTLSEGVSLNDVVIEQNQQGTVLSRITVSKTELITKTGLTKMACCNLSESFENSATVTVGFTDAISGAKQVQLLGLSGIYSQMQAENVPIMRGLASSFGWSYIPGSENNFISLF